MPYYAAGDYYRGDYYRGDLLGFFKKAASFAIKAVPGLNTAYNIASGALGGLEGLVKKGAHPNLPAPRASFSLAGQAPSGLSLMGAQGPPQFGMVNVGGGGPQSGLINIAGGAPDLGPLPHQRGYHLNKSTYETRGGGTSRWPRELELHPKGTALVRNRRMNVGNARALKRALRRAHGFARLARRVMTFTHPKAGRGHFKFRKRGKR